MVQWSRHGAWAARFQHCLLKPPFSLVWMLRLVSNWGPTKCQALFGGSHTCCFIIIFVFKERKWKNRVTKALNQNHSENWIYSEASPYSVQVLPRVSLCPCSPPLRHVQAGAGVAMAWNAQVSFPVPASSSLYYHSPLIWKNPLLMAAMIIHTLS